MKSLFTFSFNLTSKNDENYTAVHGFSYEWPDSGILPIFDSDKIHEKYDLAAEYDIEDYPPHLERCGFRTQSAESSQIKPIMKDWHDHFVSCGFKCSRVHFLGIISETGKQNFTEEDYLAFHEKWSAES